MRFIIERAGIKIIPENEQDEAYIEDTLGLKKKDDVIPCKRVAPSGLDLRIAYLKIKPEDGE